MKILVSDSLEQSCIDLLEREGFQVDNRPGISADELKSIIGQYDALIVRSATKVTADVIERAQAMKVIGRAGTGVDNIDTKAATRKGILVMNTPGGNTVSAAEHSVSLLLSLARNIPQANMSLRQGAWDRKKYIGTEVFEKTLGVVGLGKIGREVAVRCKGLGMKVIGYDPVLNPEIAEKLDIELVALQELFRRSDFITFHTPLTSETKNLISAKTLAQCKKGVRIINCARGGIVDEHALLEALESGQVGGAALDVFEQEPPGDNPLLQHRHVVATPHLGASTEEAQEKVAIQIAHQLADALHGRGFTGVVNSGALHLTMRAEVRPYLVLAEKLGSFVSQVSLGKLKSVTVSAFGEPGVSSLELLKAGVLKGILAHVLSEPVNFINAPFLAEEMGVSTLEEKVRDGENYGNFMRVRYQTDVETKEVAGTVFEPASVRFVRLDDFRFEIKPEGFLLIYTNQDKPGVLARVGSILAKHQVNIAGVSLGRTAAGATALTIMNIDSELPAEGWEELQKEALLSNVRQVFLES
jgi:D-3-phosphoglycerate dehydrogenase / 2-oxoglutarate reductase